MKNHLRRLHACISYTNYKTKKLQKDLEIGELMEMGDEVVEVPQDVSMNKKDQLDTNVMPVTKNFRKNQDLDKHMEAKHSEKQCSYCDRMCDNEEELIKHHIECIDTGVQSVSYQKCDNKFTKFAMRRH